MAYLRLGGTNALTHNDARLSALAEIRKAFANGADIAEAHAALGDIQFLYDWDWSGAEREYRRSLDLNPGLRAHAQHLCADAGDARSLRRSRWRCRKRRCASTRNRSTAWISHGMLLYYKKDFSAAEAIADRVIAQEPGNPTGMLLGGASRGSAGPLTRWRCR